MTVPSGGATGLDAVSQFVQREVVLLAILASAAVGVFQLTRVAADWERRATMRDAAAWYDIGLRQLHDGHADEAVSALRHATTRDRENRTYGTTLARALMAAGQDDDARLALLVLRDTAPDDPQISLELARLAAARDDVAEASRYYRSALYGVWTLDQVDARLRLHVEFIRFLLAQRQPTVARTELLALVPNLPNRAAAYLEAGQLLVSAGDAPRAREQFERALAMEPHNDEALAGAGEAAFASGDYSAAHRYLTDVPEPSPPLAALRDMSALIVASDPLAARLTAAERATRLTAAFTQAVQRVEECRAGATALSAEMTARLETIRREAAAFEPDLNTTALRQSPDLIETGAGLVYRLEQEAASACGPRGGLDEALRISGQRRGGPTQ